MEAQIAQAVAFHHQLHDQLERFLAQQEALPPQAPRGEVP
jgi:hypothetical protein